MPHALYIFLKTLIIIGTTYFFFLFNNMTYYYGVKIILQIILIINSIFLSYKLRYWYTKKEIRVRFAPSPTGEMHVGNLRTAIFNYIYAKQHKAKFFLRIEDTDITRSNIIYEQSIKDTLHWLNISYETYILRQSTRFHIYLEIAQKLYKQNHAYYCKCESLDQNDKNCPCEDLNLTTGVLRFRVPRNKILHFIDHILGKITVNTNTIENFVIIRSDATPTYNFVVVVDDIALKITHVFRGNEHLYNTFKQLLIYEVLKEHPPCFGHFPMINGKDGKKLSKRSGDTSVKYYKEIGVLPEALFNFLIRLGWGYGNKELFSFEEIVKLFNIKKISPSPAMFDLNKLMYLNGYYLHLNWLKHLPQIIKLINDKIHRPVTSDELNKMKKLIPEFAKRHKLVNDLAMDLLFLYQNLAIDDIVSFDIILASQIIKVLSEISEKNWLEKNLQDTLKISFPDNMKSVCEYIRLLILNSKNSPPIFLILEVLGQKKTLIKLSLFIKNYEKIENS
jgi:glutamyl-tRNA synthetase